MSHNAARSASLYKCAGCVRRTAATRNGNYAVEWRHFASTNRNEERPEKLKAEVMAIYPRELLQRQRSNGTTSMSCNAATVTGCYVTLTELKRGVSQ